jgi:hypothetical protein
MVVWGALGVINCETDRLETKRHSQAAEKKANKFVPERPGRLDDGWHDVPRELAPVTGSDTGCQTGPHAFIVTKAARSGRRPW